MIEITRLSKIGGPLTKRISIGEDGRLISDGSACIMSRGSARRVRLDQLTEFAALIQSLESHEAIALGSLRADLPDQVDITTQDKLTRLNGTAPPDLIARNSHHIIYEADKPALVLIDVDFKGMPPAVKKRISDVGGVWKALVTVLPALATAARVIRRSTSSGLSRSDTGEEIEGSMGVHVFVLVDDGGDVERFLRTFHDRCWLHGLGWMMVGAAGQLLDRSLIDRMVYAPERIVFEGPPVLHEPLVQDPGRRLPIVLDGDAIESRVVCQALTLVEQSDLERARNAESSRLAQNAAAARASFITRQTERIIQRTGCSASVAHRMVERWCNGVLLPGVILPFDSEEFAGTTVADVLNNPERFVGATLADPLEGIVYGGTKAKVMPPRPDGSIWIHSFAHGRATYELKRDASMIQASIAAAEAGAGAGQFVRMFLDADLAEDEEQRLKDEIVRKTETKLRPLNQMLKLARAEQ